MKSFHTFRLDTVNHCLWRGEDRLSLAPKAFDVLRYLVEHSDRLVTQDELLEALWPETYVNPEVVKKYVLGIRKVLGDQTSQPSFVATFPRRGYQFIAPVSDAPSSPAPSSAPRKSKTIVGRADALAQLDAALSDALRGQRQVIFITGEAGIGKTTLADVFHNRAGLAVNVRFARGQCVEGFGGKEAYYPVLEAVGQLLRDGAEAPILQAFSRRAPTWLVQFPSLIDAERREALEKEIVGATRERMVREICEALETMSLQHPLVLLLEDLHWVDPSTLDFVSALARRRGPARILLLGTYRPADVIISRSPLKALKQDLVIHNLSQEISLERLEESDIAEYLSVEFSGACLSEKFSNLIFRHSGGNSLFMVTILQDMVNGGRIQRYGETWRLSDPLDCAALHVPETLDQLIETQFQQLNGIEQRVLRCASVAGEVFSVWAIATAAELSMEGIEEACEKLAERGQFIKFAGIHELPSGQISAHYEFVHSFYREVLYRRLSEVTRSRLHLLLAQRLKAFCDPCEQELATTLALHFEGGYDFTEAVHYLILAAENAVGRLAYRDAIEILRHALDLAAKLPPATRPEVEVRILEFIGDAHFALAALPESAQAYADAAAHAEKAGLRSARVHSLVCAMYPLGFINPDEGLNAMDQALQMSGGVDDPLLAARTQMLAAGCRLVFDAWRHDDADRCESAYNTLRRLGDSDADPFQRAVYAHVLILQGKYKEALALCETVIAHDQRVSIIAHVGAVSVKTMAFIRLGNFGEVLRVTRAGRESPEENVALSWLLSYREAWLRRLAFDFEGARRICESIQKVSGEHRDGQAQTIGRVAAGYIELDRGHYDQAIEHFERVHDPQVPTKFFLHWVWRMTGQFEEGNAWLLAENPAKARVAADRFLESALSTADPHLQALAWELKARVSLAENDLTVAHNATERALAIVDRFEIPVAAWQAHATASRLALRINECDTAELHRQRSEAYILKIANSFDRGEPLRATFLAADPIRRVLGQKVSDPGLSVVSARGGYY